MNCLSTFLSLVPEKEKEEKQNMHFPLPLLFFSWIFVSFCIIIMIIIFHLLRAARGTNLEKLILTP